MTAVSLWNNSMLRRTGNDVWLWLASCGCILLLWMMLKAGQLNLICALMAGSVLLVAIVRDSATGALLTLAYLHVLGDFRRMADVVTGIPGLDLLLLVGPAVAVLLALPLLLRVRLHDALSKTMFFLTVLMLLEMFNPAQGGIAVGFSGALFYLVPMLWFWIGRHYASPQVVARLLYGILFPLAVSAALLGLYQTMIGFFPYEQAWIDSTLSSYTALSLGSTIRAFGFSVSAAEYATLLELAAAGVAAAFFGSRRLWMLAFPLLVGAMLLASGRTVVVKLIFALAVIWTLKNKRALQTGSLIRLAVLLIAGLSSVSYVASNYASSDSSMSAKRSATQESMAHLSGGLAHPFDERYSTVGIHQGMLLRAVTGSLASPLGYGLGATTGAATKFSGSSETFSSEVDFSDMFIAIGPVGGILYFVVFCLAFRNTVLYTRRTNSSVGLPVLGILSATVGSWLIAGQYSTSALIFFLVGATIHPSVAHGNSGASVEALPAPAPHHWRRTHPVDGPRHIAC